MNKSFYILGIIALLFCVYSFKCKMDYRQRQKEEFMRKHKEMIIRLEKQLDKQQIH